MPQEENRGLQQTDRRRGRRAQLDQPIGAIFSRLPVKILSISRWGALIEHHQRLWYGSRMPLHFRHRERSFSLECEVVTSWVERVTGDPLSPHVYRSGISFVDVGRLGGALDDLVSTLNPNGWKDRADS